MEPARIHLAHKAPYKLVNEYLMGGVLGEGSQGKVREAISSVTLQRVAIKIVSLHKLRKLSNTSVGLQRELAIHQQLKHTHVAELIDFFFIHEKHKVYVVLEHVLGSSLQEVLEATPDSVLPSAMARRFMRQLLLGLDYVHSQGVVHRDVKPSNLLIAAAGGVLKLADFGSAEAISHYGANDLCSKSKGSPAFQAPEVASGDAIFSGFKVDVWAAGVTLFLLTTGRVPFSGASLMHLFETIAQGKLSIPVAIRGDELLVGLLRSLMAVDQCARLEVRNALSHPWLAQQEGSERWTDADRDWIASLPKGRAPLSACGMHASTKSAARACMSAQKSSNNVIQRNSAVA